MAAYQAPKNGFRTFVFLWLSQSASVIGTSLTLFAINIWLAQVLYPAPEQKPQLAWAFTALQLCHFLPAILLTPLAGAWADRHDRKQTMLIADLLSGAGALVLAALLWTNSLQLWSLLLLAVIFGAVGAFHGAAFDTAYAMLVPDEQLPRANGMMQTMWSLAQIVAPGLAAFLIALPTVAERLGLGGPVGAILASMADGTPLAISIDAATFLLAGLVLLFLNIPSPKRASQTQPKSIWADIWFGATYVWQRKPLLWLLATFATVNLTAQFGILLPLMVKFDLAASWTARGFTYETALATLNTVTSVGAVAAGALVSAWGGLKRRRVYGVVVPLVVSAVLQVLFGLSAGFTVAIGIAALMGLTFPIANVHSQSIWQSRVPREMQGRVFAVRRVIAQFTSPVGMTLTGWLAGWLDAGLTMAILGGVAAAVCTAQFFNPYLLRVETETAHAGEAAAAVAE